MGDGGVVRNVFLCRPCRCGNHPHCQARRHALENREAIRRAAQTADAKNRKDDRLYPGEKLIIPNAGITAAEKDLLARLVHAEAKGEPYAGKVAVATVVLNRVDHPDFPDTIRAVIYERSGGRYAFTPVANGTINEPADRESYRAVEEALAFRGLGNGSLYFYNPKTAKSKWLRSRPVTVVIGNHVFAK